MKRDFYILKDMVQIMFEDRLESTILNEKLIAMEEVKEGLLQRFHELEMQLHQA